MLFYLSDWLCSFAFDLSSVNLEHNFNSLP